MTFYRVKQFFWSIFSKVNNNDIEFINRYLNKKELDLFYRLSKGEQKHSIKIATDIYESYENYFNNPIDINHRDSFVKIALLHDIGKITKRLNVVDKSMLVILSSLTKGNVKKYNKIKKIDVYYNHGVIGADILRRLGYDEYWAWIVENHHNSSVDENLEISILKKFDNIY